MELIDYLNALRRYWLTWTGIALVGLLVGAAAFTVTPRTYESTATVFVAVSPSIPNGAQFVGARVKSYPDVAVSAQVLGPVIEDLGLDETVPELQDEVSADVPADTSQVRVTVSGRDAGRTAEIANAVADEMTSVVEDLETSRSGDRPVQLTVSDPATTPKSPVSPVPLFDLGVGLLAGLFLGLAAAVVRAKLDTRVHTAEDVAAAWGDGLEVLAPRRGRARRSALSGRTAVELARRLELQAEHGQVRVALLSPSPAEQSGPRRLATAVAAELTARGVSAVVTGVVDLDRAPAGEAAVVLTVADALAPLRFWREVGARYDGAVLVVRAGRVDSSELQEVRVLLEGTGVRTTAAVLLRSSRHGKPSAAQPAPAANRTAGEPAAGRVPARSGR